MAKLSEVIERLRSEARMVYDVRSPRLGAKRPFEAVPLSAIELELAMIHELDHEDVKDRVPQKRPSR